VRSVRKKSCLYIHSTPFTLAKRIRLANKLSFSYSLLVAHASAAAKSLSAAVSALGTGSRHWEVETIFRNEG